MKIRINDLARELEVKSKQILDVLIKVGVTEKKTHSSSVEADEAEKVRKYFHENSGAPTRHRSGGLAGLCPCGSSVRFRIEGEARRLRGRRRSALPPGTSD